MLSLYEPGYIHNNNKKVLENNVLKVYTKLKLYIFPRPSTLTQYPGEREKTTSNIVWFKYDSSLQTNGISL